MGLKLVLQPLERVVINGAVIRNPDKRYKLIFYVENKSNILRESDFMREEDASTPCRRLYYIGMLAMLDEDNQEKHKQEFVSWLGEIMHALRHPIAIAAAAEIGQEIAHDNLFKALSGCRALIDYEDSALGRSEAEIDAESLA